MVAKIAPFIRKHPLFDKSRVVELGVEDAREFLIDVPFLKKSPQTNYYH
jgi:hypothetical protein